MDDLPVSDPAQAADGGPGGDPSKPSAGPHLRFGAVVPKRHARRAVTRNLMKRQMRAAVHARAHRLASGIWLLRLRAGYDAALYPSAASTALRRAVREELDRLLDACTDGAPKPA